MMLAQRSVVGLRMATSRLAKPLATAPWKVEYIEDNASFDRLVGQASGPVIVDFYADWCGPCRMLDPVLQKAAKEAGVPLFKVNCDENVETSSRFNIASLPTVSAFNKGQQVGQFVGMQGSAQISKFIEQVKTSSK